MPRFFASDENITENGVILSPEDVNHISNVLRMKKGQRLIVCDKAGFDFECEILSVGKNGVSLEILSKYKSTEPDIKIILYQGLMKLDKMEYTIQKAVELGAHRIVPFVSERAVVKLEGSGEKKLERWRKISEAAAKQCGRGIVPQIGCPLSFMAAVNEAKGAGLGLIPYELEKNTGLKQALQSFGGSEISIFIGPEGGFSENEADYARKNGIVPITLGKRILRAETAGLAVIAAAMYELGQW